MMKIKDKTVIASNDRGNLVFDADSDYVRKDKRAISIWDLGGQLPEGYFVEVKHENQA